MFTTSSSTCALVSLTSMWGMEETVTLMWHKRSASVVVECCLQPGLREERSVICTHFGDSNWWRSSTKTTTKLFCKLCIGL